MNSNTNENKTKSSKVPRFVVIHEYNGKLKMSDVFEQVIEQQLIKNFEDWLEKRKAG